MQERVGVFLNRVKVCLWRVMGIVFLVVNVI